MSIDELGYVSVHVTAQMIWKYFSRSKKSICAPSFEWIFNEIIAHSLFSARDYIIYIFIYIYSFIYIYLYKNYLQASLTLNYVLFYKRLLNSPLLFFLLLHTILKAKLSYLDTPLHTWVWNGGVPSYRTWIFFFSFLLFVEWVFLMLWFNLQYRLSQQQPGGIVTRPLDAQAKKYLRRWIVKWREGAGERGRC